MLGIRRHKFVEFSFAVSLAAPRSAKPDEELSVELVLPLDAFLEFRDRYRAEMLNPTSAAALAFDDLMRRNARP